MYPSCSKRMLRVVDTEPEMTKFASGSSGSTIRMTHFEIQMEQLLRCGVVQIH